MDSVIIILIGLALLMFLGALWQLFDPPIALVRKVKYVLCVYVSLSVLIGCWHYQRSCTSSVDCAVAQGLGWPFHAIITLGLYVTSPALLNNLRIPSVKWE